MKKDHCLHCLSTAGVQSNRLLTALALPCNHLLAVAATNPTSKPAEEREPRFKGRIWASTWERSAIPTTLYTYYYTLHIYILYIDLYNLYHAIPSHRKPHDSMNINERIFTYQVLQRGAFWRPWSTENQPNNSPLKLLVDIAWVAFHGSSLRTRVGQTPSSGFLKKNKHGETLKRKKHSHSLYDHSQNLVFFSVLVKRTGKRPLSPLNFQQTIAFRWLQTKLAIKITRLNSKKIGESVGKKRQLTRVHEVKE